MKEFSINFRRSVRDLVWLLDKNYPKKSAIELVGNRYGLNHSRRIMLYRGVFDTKSSAERKKKCVQNAEGGIQYLVIDGYNIFITLESYLNGRGVFRSLDGYVRDAAGVHGNYSFSPFTERSTELVIEAIRFTRAEKALKPGGVVYLDSPVSKSGEFAAYLREQFRGNGLDISVEVVKSPDFFIVRESQEKPYSVTATSDTAVIDKIARVIDIPHLILCKVFDARIPDLEAAI